MDVDFTTFLKFLHVLSAFLLVTGLIGRNLTMGAATRSSSVREVQVLADLAGRFDRLMVQPGSFVVLAFGLITAWRQGWPIFGFIEGASSDWLLVSLLLYGSVMALVPAVFIPQGKAFDEALKRGAASGEFTPEMRAALSNPALLAAHTYEMLAVVAVVFLMVTKPF